MKKLAFANGKVIFLSAVGVLLLIVAARSETVNLQNAGDSASFTTAPTGASDTIRILTPSNIQADYGHVIGAESDGATFTVTSNNTVKVDGRGGIGKTYEVVGHYTTGEGGTGPNIWKSRVADVVSGEVLVLKDMFQAEWDTWYPDKKTDVANGGPPPPSTLFAHAARNNNLGSVSFKINNPGDGISYKWWIRKKSDNSVVKSYQSNGKAMLASSNQFTQSVSDLVVDLYYLQVEREGGGDFQRRIDFVVFRIELKDTRPNPDNIIEFDEILGQTAGGGITSTPVMPSLKAKFLPTIPNVNVDMHLDLFYFRADRNDDNDYPTNGRKTVATGQTWDITAEMGAEIRGGTATFRCWISEKPVELFSFYIRAENPTEQAAKARLTAAGVPWFSYAIAKREGGCQNNRYYIQFNQAYPNNLGRGWEDFQYCPNRGDDPGGESYGWGIMQLTHIGFDGH